MNNEVTWHIIPDSTPLVVRHCSKCNRKMGFYCSEKFRLNSNSQNVDIWLIYKCSKCDTTWKLSLMRGIKPNDLTPELFNRLTNNDRELAWEYAFDRQLLKQSGCVVDYSGVRYSVEGPKWQDLEKPLYVQIKSRYFYDLKLSTFLAEQLGVSVSQLRKYVEQKLIAVSFDCDIMKYRIRNDFIVKVDNCTKKSSG